MNGQTDSDSVEYGLQDQKEISSQAVKSHARNLNVNVMGSNQSAKTTDGSHYTTFYKKAKPHRSNITQGFKRRRKEEMKS